MEWKGGTHPKHQTILKLFLVLLSQAGLLPVDSGLKGKSSNLHGILELGGTGIPPDNCKSVAPPVWGQCLSASREFSEVQWEIHLPLPQLSACLPHLLCYHFSRMLFLADASLFLSSNQFISELNSLDLF